MVAKGRKAAEGCSQKAFKPRSLGITAASELPVKAAARITS